MKAFSTLFLGLLLISIFYIGCSKDNPTTPPTQEPTVDFTMTYQIISDTCYFYCNPTQTVRIDWLRIIYSAGGYDHTFNYSGSIIYNPGTTYWISDFIWVNILHPADIRFIFHGRWVSDNKDYETTKDVHIP
jgi:hypothetical protein